jgi:putative transcriptional regulator
MTVLRASLNDLVSIQINADGLNRLQWRDFGNGLSMARLGRAEKRELVLYKVDADAAPGAFLRHEHIGGELYIVLRGKIADESGESQEGDVVFLDRESVHTPRAVGETLVLVFWPEGVRIIE